MTYAGYDFLALKALCARGVIAGVGTKVGVGKESGNLHSLLLILLLILPLFPLFDTHIYYLDIYICISDTDQQMIMKLHR